MYSQMKKEERVRAAVCSEEVDRIPISLWPHHTDVDQDPVKLAEAQFKLYRETDLDFVKLMPYGLYAVEDYGVKVEKYGKPDQWPKVVEDFIQKEEDWNRIGPLKVTEGNYGKQLLYVKELLKRMEAAQDPAPVIQTIFSPLTNLFKLIGEKKLFQSMEQCPDKVHQALQSITETTIQFIKENISLGVSGFFFASQLANYRFMDDAAYDRFGEKYDLQVIEAYRTETWFNVVHIHSFTPEPEKSMFTRLSNYPVNCINWHDRWAGPSLSEARKLTDKCLIGGINEEQFFNKIDYSLVYEHVREAVAEGGYRGFMLGPGCTIYEDTPLDNYLAAKIAAVKYGMR